MLGYKTGRDARRLVRDTFQEVSDLVVPTMGAKGLYVAINQDFGAATLTDDGVTVAREAAKMDGMKRMIAMDMIEAASNTEKEALDGTTLTVLLTNEIYKVGYKMIRRGGHPQVVADTLMNEVKEIRHELGFHKMAMTNQHVRDIATISTKIPMIGELVEKAYKDAGKDMNIIVEHDRENSGFKIEHTSGYTMESGFMTDAMVRLCEDGEKWKGENCNVVLMKEGIMTQVGINKFFQSIPSDEVKNPFVFVLTPQFNPNTLRILIDTLIKNNFNFQFIFINEPKPDDVYLDCAAYTNGIVQDASQGVGDYEFKHCGKAQKVVIEIDKAVFNNNYGAGVKDRVKSYKDKLEKKKYKLSGVDRTIYERRLGALTNGIVKIKVGVPTVTEYKTLQLKLDDAIGAVRKAFKHGIVLGGGKTLYNISKNGDTYNYLHLKKILRIPMKTICKNAGVKISPRLRYPKDNIVPSSMYGYDVRTGKVVNLKDTGILDSYLSIDEALKNSSSIACSYLRTNTLIIKETTHNK